MVVKNRVKDLAVLKQFYIFVYLKCTVFPKVVNKSSSKWWMRRGLFKNLQALNILFETVTIKINKRLQLKYNFNSSVTFSIIIFKVV